MNAIFTHTRLQIALKTLRTLPSFTLIQLYANDTGIKFSLEQGFQTHLYLPSSIFLEYNVPNSFTINLHFRTFMEYLQLLLDIRNEVTIEYDGADVLIMKDTSDMETYCRTFNNTEIEEFDYSYDSTALKIIMKAETLSLIIYDVSVTAGDMAFLSIEIISDQLRFGTRDQDGTTSITLNLLEETAFSVLEKNALDWRYRLKDWMKFTKSLDLADNVSFSINSGGLLSLQCAVDVGEDRPIFIEYLLAPII